MNALNQFLGGRINEDEVTAQHAIDGHDFGFDWGGVTTADGRQAARWNPWRVLSSCVGKRLILAAHHDVGPGTDRRPGEQDVILAHTCSSCGQVDEHAIAWPCDTVRFLALDWAEHVDYRSEWRPPRRHPCVG
jgi:hypothetical protein